MSFLLICPPVGPFHAPTEIEAWIAELAAKRRRYAGDAGALARISRAEVDAAHMLALAHQADAALGEPSWGAPGEGASPAD